MVNNNNLKQLKNRFVTDEKKELECYDTYYRICQDYIHDIIINFQSYEAKEKVLKYGDIEYLDMFNGKVIKREQNNKQPKLKSESRFQEVSRYRKIALQKTVMRKILKYAKKNNINIWEINFLRIKFIYFGKNRNADCIVYDLDEISSNYYYETTSKIDGGIGGGIDGGIDGGTYWNKDKE